MRSNVPVSRCSRSEAANYFLVYANPHAIVYPKKRFVWRVCLFPTFLVIPTVVEAEGQIYWVSSTAYEWTGDRMASGEWPYYGAAACNFLPISTRVLVLDGSKAGGVFVVKDRIGRGSDFDIYLGDVNIANQYGRQFIRIQVLEGAANLDEFRAKNVGVSTWVWIKTLYGAHVK